MSLHCWAVFFNYSLLIPGRYVDTVNLSTMPRRTPKVTMPRMIHMTTKWPEQQPRPAFFSSLLGTGETFLETSRMGSLLGAPFSAITILWWPGRGWPPWPPTWLWPREAMLACSDLLSPASMWPPWWWWWWWWGCGAGPAACESSATDLALLTVVAPEMTEGGTE